MQPPRQSVLQARSRATSSGRSQAGCRLRSQAQGEDGVILLAVLFLVILILIALAVAAPSMARSIQRDKEVELMHRGDQYKRAIKLYYKKFGAYPTSIDQLLNTNQIRFLRKRYSDPITGKDDWRIIHLGEAKVPPMGLFGQPLAGIGATPANIGTPVGSATGQSFMGTPAGGLSGAGTGSSAFGAAPGSSTPESPTGTDSTSTDPFGSDSGTAASDAGFASSSTNPASPTGTSATSTSATGTSATGSAFGGPSIGGGPIVGVGIPSTKASIIEYKKQKHYNQWEFVYNPIEDQMMSAGLMGGGTQNINGANPGTSNGFGPTTSGTRGNNPSSGFGTSSGGAIGSPTSPTDPTQSPE
jgi:type II secretory pathway pseudopilin PulG